MESFFRRFVQNYARTIKKSTPENLLKILSAIEYTEAILEITSAKVFGEKFKWLVILLIQFTKCVIRLQLLILHKIGIQTLPSFFDIKHFLNSSRLSTKKKETNLEIKTLDNNDGFFTLKHSGRVMRTLSNSPTNPEFRNWTLPATSQITETDAHTNREADSDSDEEDIDVDPVKDKQRFVAEILYIMRPLCHLTSMFIFNSKSWTQFFIPLTIDLLSLLMMHGTQNMSKSQRSEMKRRAFQFIHYFIRSPLYELYSSQLITVLLNMVDQRVPGFKLISKPIKEYVPYWRSIYAYCWTS